VSAVDDGPAAPPSGVDEGLADEAFAKARLDSLEKEGAEDYHAARSALLRFIEQYKGSRREGEAAELLARLDERISRSLDRLRVGDAVSFYGPYGHFSDPFCEALRNCVFVGGGIGITPFIGMWHVALHSEDRYDAAAVPEPIRQMHPEILRRWQSPLVSLFYVCRTAEDAAFDTAIRNEVILSQFHGFSELEHRGHHYELYDTSTQGLITASYLDAHVRGGIRDKLVFLCGPTPMVDALIKQMKAMAMCHEQIIVEDFNLV
jgi:predicted ferric reductase